MVPPELRQDPHVSFTQLDTYLRCPLRYRLQYVDRVIAGPQRRTRVMNGRCQGFYCGAHTRELLSARGEIR